MQYLYQAVTVDLAVGAERAKCILGVSNSK